ncbi:MAG: ABC transporter ATP-binding protein [Oligoflexia bacterium]|nr:ABC transporter ATP-binding protein [Oligoflexia bacterium]
MINFIEISKKFKTDFWSKSFYALNGVAFKVSEGEITGFLGANGAGKTTLIKILMGFIFATSGSIEFDEKLGKNRREIFSKIGLLPERPYFYPYLTGREFVYYLGSLNDVKKSDLEERLIYWSKRMGIVDALDRKLKTYSKGMLQRLGLITTIIHEPKLVILDEPLSGLDPIGRKELKDAIVEINKKGSTVFFSSHIVPDVEEICKNVVFLEKGKLLYNGPIDDIIEKNVKPSYIIKYFNGTEVVRVEVQNKDKEKLIQDLLVDSNNKILTVEKFKVSLEEIFYKIRT